MELQYEDPCIGQVLQWLEDECDPLPDELRAMPLETRKLWGQRPLIKLRDGLLVKQTDSKCQLIVPVTIRRQLFERDFVHGGTLSAHLGRDKCQSQLKQSYNWPGMRRDVDSLSLIHI